jgi:site-specific recombinase XerD
MAVRTEIEPMLPPFLAVRVQGNLSGASYSSDVYRLEQFKQHCEREHKSKLSDIVSAEFLGDYRGKLLDQLAKGKTSAVSVKHVLRTIKAMLKWGYKQENIDRLPRVLDDYAKVALPPPTPQFYTTEEITTLFDAASPRTQFNRVRQDYARRPMNR